MQSTPIRYASAAVISPCGRLLLHSTAGHCLDKKATSTLTVETFVPKDVEAYHEIESEMRLILRMKSLDALNLRYSLKTKTKTKLGGIRELYLFFYEQKTSCTFGTFRPNRLNLLPVNDAINHHIMGRLTLTATAEVMLRAAKNMIDNNMRN